MFDCKITKRLLFAKKKWELDSYCYEACALGFNETSCFDMLRIKNLTICNPEKSVIKKAVRNNHLTLTRKKCSETIAKKIPALLANWSKMSIFL